MTQEELYNLKNLLLRDLCARLPYGVVGQCEIDASYDTPFDTIPQTHKFNAVVYGIKDDLLFVSPMIENQDEIEFANEETDDGVDILEFKPYLFPLSSMTEKQKKEYQYITERWMYDPSYSISDSTDWLNKNHFDYRGLIEKGLAIGATGLNIY